MNETERYILDTIRVCVWSGFYDSDEVHEIIDDILEEDADEQLLRAAVAPEFEKKLAAEASWSEFTDCDRLDEAFEVLDGDGIIALHNAGYTMSDGLSDVGEELHQRGRENVEGYCFYHGQDVERAVAGDGLTIAFGDLDDDETQRADIGRRVRTILELHGLAVEWNGDPDARLVIPRFDWKRRSPG